MAQFVLKEINNFIFIACYCSRRELRRQKAVERWTAAGRESGAAILLAMI